MDRYPLKCSKTGRDDCLSCNDCLYELAYGNCFNCKMRNPITSYPEQSEHDRCHDCSQLPQVERLITIPLTKTGWVCDGGLIINRVGIAIFDHHSACNNMKRKTFDELVESINELSTFNWVKF